MTSDLAPASCDPPATSQCELAMARALKEKDWEQQLFDLLPAQNADLFLAIEAAILERAPQQLALWLAEVIRGMSEKEVSRFAQGLDGVLAAMGNGLYITTVGDILCIRGNDGVDYMVNPRGKTSPIAPSFLPRPSRQQATNRWGFGC